MVSSIRSPDSSRGVFAGLRKSLGMFAVAGMMTFTLMGATTSDPTCVQQLGQLSVVEIEGFSVSLKAQKKKERKLRLKKDGMLKLKIICC
jgi:hypothetical protein